MNHQDNAFDLIRHYAALMVLYAHHYVFLGLPAPTFPHWDTWGFVAVAIFFAVSGYFMPTSFNNSSGMIEFITKRVRRIFPGLIVCCFIMVYVIGAIFTDKPALKYLVSGWTFETFVMWSAFIGRSIPGVFSDFIMKDAINGSLWTLPVEFAAYLIFATALALSNNIRTVFALWLASAVSTAFLFHTGVNYSFYAVPMNYLSIFGLAFTTGSLLAMTQPHWMPIRKHLALLAVLFLYLFRGRPEMQVMGTMSLAVLAVVIGVSFKDKLIRGRFDLSYGIYIYAFPIQQMVINLVTKRFWPSMILAVLLTLVAAYLSYRFVEKPFLKRKPKVEGGNNVTVLKVDPVAHAHQNASRQAS